MSSKTIITLSDEQNSLIESLLRDTSEQFAAAFKKLANSNISEDQRKFVAHWIALVELTLPKVY